MPIHRVLSASLILITD